MEKINEKKFVTVGEASRLTGLEIQTVRKMADEGTLVSYKTPSGQRRLNLDCINKLCGNSVKKGNKMVPKRENFIYIRISNNKQTADLAKQLETLSLPEYADYKIITDAASGSNYKRVGLSLILDSCLKGIVGEIVIVNKFIICRSGFELLEEMVLKAGGKITVVSNNIVTPVE